MEFQIIFPKVPKGVSGLLRPITAVCLSHSQYFEGCCLELTVSKNDDIRHRHACYMFHTSSGRFRNTENHDMTMFFVGVITVDPKS